MDPDYELSETVREEANKRREKDKLEQIEKAKIKINEDFQKECDLRENQLVEIQNRITCLAKTLHVLRYVLVSSFYNKPEANLQLPDDELRLVDKQQRLHPAIKRLTNERDLSRLDFFRRKTRRSHKQTVQVMPIEENITIVEKSNVEVDTSPKTDCEKDLGFLRNRPMSKRKIIVGNISKWMPSDNSEDNSTHKWMVYIRGPQENPRIDDIIKKVVFHLHPSYHPHDVIEVGDHPFHLTRRGWGEFPMRCQLVFRNHLNKPVNIIHHLKLDKTYSGMQTLGNETHLSLTIYDENAQPVEDSEMIIKQEEEEILEQDENMTDNNLYEYDDGQETATDGTEAEWSQISDDSVRIKIEATETMIDNVSTLDTNYQETTNSMVLDSLCPALKDHNYSMTNLRFI